jgi:hypothetical protein
MLDCMEFHDSEAGEQSSCQRWHRRRSDDLSAVCLVADGASRGNPGLASLGICVRDSVGIKVKEVAKRIGTTTCNVAEWTAVIEGLQLALQVRPRHVLGVSCQRRACCKVPASWP